MSITIDIKDRNYIYGVIGSPNISITDTGLLTDAIVDDQVIEPSLIEYFRFFPIEKIVNTQITSGDSSITVPFPDDEGDISTFSVKDCRLNQLQDTQAIANTSNITNPMVQFRSINQTYGNGRLGSNFDYGFSTIQSSVNAGNDALTAMNQVFYNKTDHIKREVTIYSRNPGVVQTTFAQYSTNVNHILYTSKREFLDLCRGELLLYWANNLKRINPEFPVAFNVDDLVTDGEDLKELTINKWRNKSKSVIMRG